MSTSDGRRRAYAGPWPDDTTWDSWTESEKLAWGTAIACAIQRQLGIGDDAEEPCDDGD